MNFYPNPGGPILFALTTVQIVILYVNNCPDLKVSKRSGVFFSHTLKEHELTLCFTVHRSMVSLQALFQAVCLNMHTFHSLVHLRILETQSYQEQNHALDISIWDQVLLVSVPFS
jgi:hypothetical protein